MSEMQRLRKYFDDAVARALRKRQLPGELGKAPGVSDASNFTVPGKPGYTWVRVTSGDGVTVVPAINHVVANKPDVPVWVEPNEGGVYEVTRIRAEDFLVFSGGATLPNTSAAPTANAPTTARRLVPGLVVHESGLTVRIQAFHYRYGVQSRYYPGGTLDLTSYVPTTSNRQVWCKVGVDPVSNSAVAVAGGEQVATVPLLDEALAAVDFSLYIPLAGVKLKTGDTSLASAARFADCRPWWTVQAEPWRLPAPQTVTLSAGAVTVSQTACLVTSETGTADDLATLTAVGENTFVLLKADTGHTITVKHGTGNIALNGGADFVLNSEKTLLLYYDGSTWADVGAGGGSSGTDAAAIHDNVAGEIAALVEKATPASADLLLIEDSAASNTKKKVQVGNLPGGSGGSITVEDADSSPSVSNVTTLKFPNGTVTDNGGGVVSLGLGAVPGQVVQDVLTLAVTRSSLQEGIGRLSSGSYASQSQEITFYNATTMYGVYAYVYSAATYKVELWDATATTKYAESGDVVASSGTEWIQLAFTTPYNVSALTYRVKVVSTPATRMYATPDATIYYDDIGPAFRIDNWEYTNPYPPLRIDYDLQVFSPIDLTVPATPGVQLAASVQTTDATATDIATIALAEGEAVTVRGMVVGLKSDGSAACGGDFRATFRRAAGGNVTLVGSLSANVSEDSAGSPSFTVVADTTAQTVAIRVTGVAAETWEWQVMYDYIQAPAV